MGDVATHRDLSCFIAEPVKQRAECHCTLQSYLQNLRRLGYALRAREAVSPEEFAEVRRAAFAPAPGASEAGAAATNGYVAWEKRIGEQIRHLAAMRQSGTLDNGYRYFGVDAPRGGRWSVVQLLAWEMFVDFLNAGQWYE